MASFKLVVNDVNSTPIAFINKGYDDDDKRGFVGYIEVDVKDLKKEQKKSYKNFFEDDSSESEDEYEFFVDKNNKHHIKLNSGKFEVFPNLYGEHGAYNLSGSRGSGKSYITKQFCKNYHSLYPNNKIIIISPVTSDKNFKGSGFYRINLEDDDSVYDLKIDDFKDSLVVFDDLEGLEQIDPDKYKFLHNLQDNLLLIGRHVGEEDNKNALRNDHAPTLIVITHTMCNYKKTKTVLNESSDSIFFPCSSGKYNINRLLKNYVGLDNKQIKYILDLPSRWVCVHRNFPMYVVSEREIFFL